MSGRGEAEEVLSYYPEYRETFAEIEVDMAILGLRYCFLRYLVRKEFETKKELAMKISGKDRITQSFYFKAYDGVSWEELKSKWKVKDWLNYLTILEGE